MTMQFLCLSIPLGFWDTLGSSGLLYPLLCSDTLRYMVQSNASSRDHVSSDQIVPTVLGIHELQVDSENIIYTLFKCDLRLAWWIG